MGKIRVKTIGLDEAEEQEKKEAQKRKEAKQATAKEKPEEKLETDDVIESKAEKKQKKHPKKETSKEKHSNSYKKVSTKIDDSKKYSISEALDLLKEMQRTKFDETVELHINVTETGVSGQITLPHGSGKQVRVAIADDKLISEIEKGKLDFDVLLAEPAMMPKLAKVAKVLGPRGLMPNPKNGTISNNPQELAKKYQGGQINFKTEPKTPVIHLAVGKASFENKKLEENIKTVLNSIKKDQIKKVVLSSTMSPGIKLFI